MVALGVIFVIWVVCKCIGCILTSYSNEAHNKDFAKMNGYKGYYDRHGDYKKF